MQGKGDQTAEPTSRSAAVSWLRRRCALEWAGFVVAAVAVATTLSTAGSWVEAVPVAVLAGITVALASRSPERAVLDDRPVDGPDRLHAEVERARRLEYSFALVQLDRTYGDEDAETVVRAERRIRSMLRTTDVLMDHDSDLFLVLPSSQVDGLSAVWGRLSEAFPEEMGFWRERSIAVFPDDSVTGEGLLEVCRRRAGSKDANTANGHRASDVTIDLTDAAIAADTEIDLRNAAHAVDAADDPEAVR